MTDRYRVERITEEPADSPIGNFLYESAIKVNRMYGDKFDWREFLIWEFARTNLLLVCFRDENPVGFLAASIFKSFFDVKCVVLKQNLLYSLPNTRASHLLLKEFIDFGKANANHVITTIGTETNIKPRSLKKLGFKKLEESYRMETRR